MVDSKWTRVILSLTALEGLAALAAYFSGLEGRSTTRLALGGLAALTELALLAGTAALLLNPLLVERPVRRMENWLAVGWRRTQLVTALGFLAALAAGVAWLFNAPWASDYERYAPLFTDLEGIARFETLRGLAASALPLLAWAALGLLELAALLALTAPAGWWNGPAFWKTLLVLVLAAATAVHWILLGYQVKLLANIPGWYWQVGPHEMSGSPWIFVVLAALGVGLGMLVWRRPRRTVLNLLLLVLFGYALQVGFGFLDGRGYEYVRLKYAGTLHRSYAMRASSANADVLAAVRDYESLYGDSMFPSTKPPGVMVFYIAAGKLVNLFNPQPSATARFEALTRFEAAVFPVISFLVVIVLYRLGRGFLDEREAYIPPLLYLTAPNIILLPLFLDQVLYPLLFSLGVLLTVRAARLGGFWPGVWLGAGLYLAAFFSFSLLPLAVFSVLYLGIDALRRRGERPVLSQARVAAGMAVGAGILFLAFWLFLNYDVITRYRHAMSVVHYYDYFERAGAAESGAYTRGFFPNLSELLGAMALNNIDFAAATGFPLYLLFLVGGVRSLVELARGKIMTGELLLPVYFLVFLAMNLYGQNRGESSRLWMFWVPAVALLAGREVTRLFEHRRWAVLALVLSGLVTILLTFLYQDFWM